MGEKIEAPPTAAEVLKEQLGLFAFLVLFAGLVATETYYSAFGIRYQLLEFSVEHLIYRGVTALLTGWPLGIAYVATMAWLAVGASWFAARGPLSLRLAQVANYGVVILVVAIAYPTAIASGRSAAERDLSSDSELPTVRAIFDTSRKALPYANNRLLLAGKDTVAVFLPAARANDQPFIHLLRREDIGEIIITR